MSAFNRMLSPARVAAARRALNRSVTLQSDVRGLALSAALRAKDERNGSVKTSARSDTPSSLDAGSSSSSSSTSVSSTTATSSRPITSQTSGGSTSTKPGAAPLRKPVQISYNPPNKAGSGGGSITLNLPPNLVEAMSRKKNVAATKPSSARAKAQASKALRQTLPEPTTGEVYAWATSYSYSFRDLIRSGRLPSNYQIFEDNEVIHIPQWPVPSENHASSQSKSSADQPSSSEFGNVGRGEVFIFRSGSYVTWGLDEEQSSRFLRNVIQGRDLQFQVEVGRYNKIGDEVMDYLYAPSQPTRVQGDIIVIGQPPKAFDAEEEVSSSSSSDPSSSTLDGSESGLETSDSSAAASSTSTAGSATSKTTAYTSFGSEWTPVLARLAFSQGLARSARLSVQESSLSTFLSSVSSIPSQLETVGKVPLSRTSVIKHMGTLLRLRQTANLDRDNFYDEPEVYWENSKMEDHYRAICHELDISQRFETLNEKLDHCENLLGVVRALLTESTTHRMELIIIALIAFEATIAVISHDWLPTPTNLADAWSYLMDYFGGGSTTTDSTTSSLGSAASTNPTEEQAKTSSASHQI